MVAEVAVLLILPQAERAVVAVAEQVLQTLEVEQTELRTRAAVAVAELML